MHRLPKERNKVAFRLAAVLLLAVAVLSTVYVLHVGREMTDFGVFYLGGQRILQGETLYREADGHLQYKYSPTSALFFAPLSLLPYGAAKVVWYILEFAFLAGIFVLCFRALPVADKKAAPVFIWTLLIELKFLAREIELGQVNLLILFLLTSMLYLLLRKKENSAGVLWGFSVFFKPYALVFLPYFLVKRKFRLFASGLTVVLFGLMIPMLFYGVRGNISVLSEWPLTLSKSTPGLLASFDNASLFGFLYKAFPSLHDQAVNAILSGTLLILALAVLMMIQKGVEARIQRPPEVLESGFLLILMPLFSPLGWNYNYLYSIPAVMLIVAAWPRLPAAWRTVLIANFLTISTSLVEIWTRKLFHFYTHYALVSVNFLVVLGALFYLRLRHKA